MKGKAVDTAESRLEEMFDDTIAPGIKTLEENGFSVEVVLSGGVMLQPGLKEYAQKHLETEVRIGSPVLAQEMPDGRNDCRYCAAAGLIAYLSERRRNPYAYVEPPMKIFKSYEVMDPKTTKNAVRGRSESKVKSLSRTLKGIVKELF